MTVSINRDSARDTIRIDGMSRDEFHATLRKLPVYNGKRVCRHTKTAVLAGYVICNDGCGTCLGPDNG